MNGTDVVVGMPLFLANPGAERGAVLSGTVDRIGKDGFVVLTEGAACTRREIVEVTHPAPNARYQLSARVEATDARHVVLVPLSPWVRVQQRAFVRYRPSSQLPIEVRRIDPQGYPSTEAVAGKLVDVSAGGAQIELPEAVDDADLLQVRLQLPSSDEVRACARIVRTVSANVPESDGSDSTPPDGVRLGLQFIDLGRAAEQTILRWIFRQQAAARRTGQ